MRRLLLLGLLTVMAIRAGAAKPGADTRITVAQLEQTLTAASAAHKSDDAIARQIRGMELSERLTDATLERLSANLKSGSKAALALHLLADQSTFLDPPASELRATPAPDDTAQQGLLQAARNYVAQTLLQLPNFLATQTVRRFDNSGVALGRAGLHLAETSSWEVSTRAPLQSQTFLNRLASWGEFGSAVAVVLLNDTAHGTVTWSHWEQMPAGTAAVFHYAVPKAASHFDIAHTTTGHGGIMEAYGHPESRLQPTRSPAANETHTSSKPGYSGSLWLDPSTGIILRITIEADPKDIFPYYKHASMMMQYGPVTIGDGDFVCPLRSISILSLTDGAARDQIIENELAPTQWLSETLFTGYHHFKATARILTDAGAAH